MKKRIREITAVLLAVVMLVLVVSAQINAAESPLYGSVGESGTTGNCTWKLNGTNLTISGNGSMGNYVWYSGSTSAPWGNKITTVTIESGVTNVGDFAFYFCDKLTTVSLPDGLMSIGTDAFADCHVLSSISLPSSLRSIKSGAFMRCKKLKTIDIPSSVSNIDAYAFCECEYLATITLPSRLSSIGTQMFFGCYNLISVSIPDGVREIDDYVFYNCRKLSNVIMPEGIERIGAHAFNGCESLGKISISPGVTYLGYCSFSNCKSLSSVTIPKSVKTICEDSFNNCSKISNVFYNGTIGDWRGIEIKTGNQPILSAQIHYRDFTIGIDTNSFVHSKNPDYINSGFLGRSDYSIEKSYFSRLASLGILPADYAFMKYGMSRKWDGSCYGIAMAMANLYNGEIGLSDLNDHNSESFFEIGLPWRNPKLDNAINLYYLTQYSFSLNKKDVSQLNRISFLNDVVGESMQREFLKELVRCASEPKIYILDYNFLKANIGNVGHSILITNCTYDLEKKWYVITLFDMNSVEKVYNSYNYVTSNFNKGEPTYIYVNDDFSGFSVNGYKATDILEYNYLRIVDPQNDKLNMSIRNVSNNNNKGNKGLESVGSNENKTVNFSFLLNQKFRLTNEQGQSLCCSGDGLTCDFEIFNVDYIDNENGTRVLITVSDGKYTLECNGEIVEITMSDEDSFLAFKGERFDLVNLSLEDGIEMNGNDYSFEASLTTDELLNQSGEKNLVQINGTATSNVKLIPGESNIQVETNERITDAQVTNFVSNQSYKQDLETIESNSVIQNLLSKYGDADYDGDININDVTIIQRHLAELQLLEDKQEIISDTNADGEITIEDVTRIQLYLAEYNVTLG